MKVAIRVDASHVIGSGHLMRCLTLAHALKQHQVDTLFISRELPDHMLGTIENHGYQLVRLPAPVEPVVNPANEYDEWLGVPWESDAEQTQAALGAGVDCLVVDHYGLDHRWHRAVAPRTAKILVIDDLANRPLHCDFVLNQNLMSHPESAYQGLLADECITMLGPRFALLRDEFVSQRAQCERRTEHGSRVFVFLGGADRPNLTEVVVRALKAWPVRDVEATILVGSANHNRSSLASLCADSGNIKVLTYAENMAELLAQSDVAIGAGGTSTWERCALGLPSILVTLAENQRGNCEQAHELGAALHLGLAEEVDEELVNDAFRHLLRDSKAWLNMSMKAAKLVDGQGTQRVIQAIFKDS